MESWTRNGLDFANLRRLPLTSEEGFVLSRLDVPLTTAEVAALTGFAPERALEILVHLAEVGAIAGPAPRAAEAVRPVPPLEPSPPAPDDAMRDHAGVEPGHDGGEPSPQSESEAPDEEGSEDGPDSDEGPAPIDEASYRKLYEATFRGATQEARIAAAHTAGQRELMALCLDAEAAVLYAVLANPSCALPHARFAARWHPTAAGLEAIAQRGNFISDPQVQRLLLRNAHLSELLTRRILNGKRMLDAYKASVDTDVPERTRLFARTVLRTKFGTSQGEERAGLICATDGRVLAALAGLSLDGRATSTLCARSYTSALLVQNLARFGTCPPQLLAYLLRQPLVRRQNHLKSMLLQHPNMPAEAKRKL